MKIKKLIIGLSSIGLLATITPASPIATNQLTFDNSQNMQMQSLDVGSKLTEIKSINKSCENLVTFNTAPGIRESVDSDHKKYIINIDSLVKIEDDNGNFGQKGKIERDDLFTYTRADTQYTSYHRYKSNHVEKNNHTSWGNAKKYQLNVTVPANTEKYKVQVVADVKIKNCVKGCWFDAEGIRGSESFLQANLSKLSTDPNQTLMPYMGIMDANIYDYIDHNRLSIKTENELFKTLENYEFWEEKPYQKAKLSSTITLANKTPEAKEIPVYFWYGFFGGGYTGYGKGSHINCSEVTFSANHIE